MDCSAIIKKIEENKLLPDKIDTGDKAKLLDKSWEVLLAESIAKLVDKEKQAIISEEVLSTLKTAVSV